MSKLFVLCIVVCEPAGFYTAQKLRYTQTAKGRSCRLCSIDKAGIFEVAQGRSCRLCSTLLFAIGSYKVVVIVKDHTCKTTFTLFNKEAERLIGVSIQTLIGEIGQDNLMTTIPPTVTNIKGQKCAFEVKLTSFNQDGRECYTVARLSEVLPPPPDNQDLTGNIEGDHAKKQRVV